MGLGELMGFISQCAQESEGVEFFLLLLCFFLLLFCLILFLGWLDSGDSEFQGDVHIYECLDVDVLGDELDGLLEPALGGREEVSCTQEDAQGCVVVLCQLFKNVCEVVNDSFLVFCIPGYGGCDCLGFFCFSFCCLSFCSSVVEQQFIFLS